MGFAGSSEDDLELGHGTAPHAGAPSGPFPLEIIGFHADNGSEYVNHRVAALLERLRAEFTKSRPRHSNDNALVEQERQRRAPLARTHPHPAPLVGEFTRCVPSPAVNFHRPCTFAVERVDE